MLREQSERDYRYPFEENWAKKRMKVTSEKTTEAFDYEQDASQRKMSKQISQRDGLSIFALEHLVVPTFSQLFGTVSKIMASSAFDVDLLETPTKRVCIYALLLSFENYKRLVKTRLVIPDGTSNADEYANIQRAALNYEIDVESARPVINGSNGVERAFCLGVCELQTNYDEANTTINYDAIRDEIKHTVNQYHDEYEVSVIPLCIVSSTLVSNFFPNVDAPNVSDGIYGPIAEMLRHMRMVEIRDDCDVLNVRTKVVTSGEPNIKLTLETHRYVDVKVTSFKSEAISHFLSSLIHRRIINDYGLACEYCCTLVSDGWIGKSFKRLCLKELVDEFDICSYDDTLGYLKNTNVDAYPQLNVDATRSHANIVYSNMYVGYQIHLNDLFECRFYFTIDLLDHFVLNMISSKDRQYSRYSLFSKDNYTDDRHFFNKLLGILSVKWQRRVFHRSDESFSVLNYAIMSPHAQ